MSSHEENSKDNGRFYPWLFGKEKFSDCKMLFEGEGFIFVCRPTNAGRYWSTEDESTFMLG